jgi:anti-anti-sigma factor
LADQLWSVLDRHFTYRLVLELDRVQVLGSFLIGQLIQLHQRIEQHGGVLRVCGLSPHNRRVLRTCRLHNQFPPYRTREEAVMGCVRPRQPK